MDVPRSSHKGEPLRGSCAFLVAFSGCGKSQTRNTMNHTITPLEHHHTNPLAFDFSKAVLCEVSRGLAEGGELVTKPRPLQVGKDLVVSYIASGWSEFTMQASCCGDDWANVESLDLPAENQVMRRYRFEPSARYVRFLAKAKRATSRISIFSQCREAA